MMLRMKVRELMMPRNETAVDVVEVLDMEDTVTVTE